MEEEIEAIHGRPQSQNTPPPWGTSPWTAERGQPSTINSLELGEGLAEKSEESVSPDLSSLPLIVF